MATLNNCDSGLDKNTHQVKNLNFPHLKKKNEKPYYKSATGWFIFYSLGCSVTDCPHECSGQTFVVTSLNPLWPSCTFKSVFSPQSLWCGPHWVSIPHTEPEDMRASVKHAHQLQRWRSQRWPGQLELINRLHGLKSVCTLSSHRPDYKDQMIFTARKWSQKICKWLLQTQLYKPQQHGAHSGSEELKMTRFHTHHECLIIFWMVMSREPARSVKTN